MEKWGYFFLARMKGLYCVDEAEVYIVLSSFQIIRRFNFSRYIDFAKTFKSSHLGTLPRGLSTILDTPSLPLRVVHTGSDSDPHVVPPLSLSYHFTPKVARWFSILNRVQYPPQ